MDDIIVKTVRIEEVSCKETKTSKNNKQYCSCGIKVGGKWYNGLMWGDQIEQVNNWKAGDDMTLAFFQEEYQGKMYSKFKLPSKTDLLYNEINYLKEQIKLIRDHLNI